MVDPNPTTSMIALSFNDKLSNKKQNWQNGENTDSGWK